MKQPHAYNTRRVVDTLEYLLLRPALQKARIFDSSHEVQAVGFGVEGGLEPSLSDAAPHLRGKQRKPATNVRWAR